MRSEQLRAIQAPLKERYREDAGSARLTLSATGELGAGVSCSVRTGRALAEAGLHPMTGGDGTQLCSGDMLLDTDAPPEQVDKLVELTERYCVVLQTLRAAPEISVGAP